MELTRTSIATGKIHTMELPITPEQLEEWRNGRLIQDVFPNLSKDQREFIMTGITAEEWDALFSEEEE